MTCPHPNGKILLFNTYVDCDCKIKGPRWDGKTLRDQKTLDGQLMRGHQNHIVLSEEYLLPALGPFQYGRIRLAHDQAAGEIILGNKVYSFSYEGENAQDVMESALFMGSRWYDAVRENSNIFVQPLYKRHVPSPGIARTGDEVVFSCTLPLESTVEEMNRKLMEMADSVIENFGDIRGRCHTAKLNFEGPCGLSRVVNQDGYTFRFGYRMEFLFRSVNLSLEFTL